MINSSKKKKKKMLPSISAIITVRITKKTGIIITTTKLLKLANTACNGNYSMNKSSVVAWEEQCWAELWELQQE